MRMRAPHDAQNVTVPGPHTYTVVSGAIDNVSPLHVPDLIAAGFRLRDEEEELRDAMKTVDNDVIKNLQPVVPHVELAAPAEFDGVSVLLDGQPFEVKDGMIRVPASLVSAANVLGFAVPAPKELTAAEKHAAFISTMTTHGLRLYLKERGVAVLGKKTLEELQTMALEAPLDPLPVPPKDADANG